MILVKSANLINAIGITAVKLMAGCISYGGRIDRHLDVTLHQVIRYFRKN